MSLAEEYYSRHSQRNITRVTRNNVSRRLLVIVRTYRFRVQQQYSYSTFQYAAVYLVRQHTRRPPTLHVAPFLIHIINVAKNCKKQYPCIREDTSLRDNTTACTKVFTTWVLYSRKLVPRVYEK